MFGDVLIQILYPPQSNFFRIRIEDLAHLVIRK